MVFAVIKMTCFVPNRTIDRLATSYLCNSIHQTVQYQEFKPAALLEGYVKCYYTLSCGPKEIEDRAFATGCVELMFTLRGKPWRTGNNGKFTDSSHVELWGQIVTPLAFKTSGESSMVGIRFHPTSAAFLLQSDVSQFNDGVFDAVDVVGNSIRELHEKLRNAVSVEEQLSHLDGFLIKKLASKPEVTAQIDLIRHVSRELMHPGFVDSIEDIATRYGISARHLQKLFSRYTGITAKKHIQINRFQSSLALLNKSDRPLTAIAYDCGYFDQSHFIREFKSFSGTTPSGFDLSGTTAVLLSSDK